MSARHDRWYSPHGSEGMFCACCQRSLRPLGDGSFPRHKSVPRGDWCWGSGMQPERVQFEMDRVAVLAAAKLERPRGGGRPSAGGKGE